MDYFIHPQAICDAKRVGSGTRIWAFAHVLEGAVIGRDVNICDHTFIENDVVIGDRVTIKSGVQLWDGVRIEDDVFLGPNATFTNDRFPRSKVYPEAFLRTVVCKGASVGANATILPGMTIGQNSMVGAGAVVTRSVPANAIVTGNPARIRGYVDSPASAIATEPASARAGDLEGVMRSRVRDVTVHRLALNRDLRGSLTAGEFNKEIPFVPKRFFLVFDVSSSEIRGEHAHRTCHQFFTCVRGACSVVADDGESREEFRLDSPTVGVYLPPLVWATQYKHTSDVVLLVLASDYYDPDDYIRDYQQFLDEVQRARS
jgi:acetyltransferase-like isoleucine patch superfamily enzyme/dTDP-4-dehydrorhamnose 3,5-epimerase-like enzyme